MAIDTTSSQWLTAEQMARQLGVKPATLRDWARKRLVPSIKPTQRTLRFEQEQVVAALRARCQGVAG